MGWDVELLKPIFRIEHKVSDKEMNTINSLAFANRSDNIFSCATRDGYVRLYDARIAKNAVIEYKAHSQKLNTACFNQSNTEILTCARDCLIRLWDIRKLIVFF